MAKRHVGESMKWLKRLFKRKNKGVYQCFHCLHNTVCWNCDYDFEDFGYDGEGIVHICTCSNCGAEIEYRISLDAS